MGLVTISLRNQADHADGLQPISLLAYVKLDNSVLCATQWHLQSACGPLSCMLSM